VVELQSEYTSLFLKLFRGVNVQRFNTPSEVQGMFSYNDRTDTLQNQDLYTIFEKKRNHINHVLIIFYII
jgi:hypothetical protein